MNLDTKPSLVRKRVRLPWRWIAVAVVAVAIVGVVALLTVPVLLTPPPAIGPGYELPVFGEASAALEGGKDVLLSTSDGLVSVYAPSGAYPGTGTLVLQTRRPELVPFQMAEGIERVRAVDLVVLGPGGEVLPFAAFSHPILLCFRLEEHVEAVHADDPSSVTVERFDDNPATLKWMPLPIVPGWEEHQLCASIEHLSLFALSVRRLAATGIPPESSPTPESTPVGPGLYAPPATP